MNYWPEKLGGIWNFPLAQVRIVGTPAPGKRTLSMDYNFYYAQSAGLPEPENKAIYEKQMLDAYMEYFQTNYFGNRAPVHMGHHFSKWNGGAYWEAMQTFTKKVCGLPEVKCVPYSELVMYMEAHQADRAKFQAGQFTPLPRPPGAAQPAPIEDAVPEDQLAAEGLIGLCPGDSGGPLYKKRSGALVVVGVNSNYTLGPEENDQVGLPITNWHTKLDEQSRHGVAAWLRSVGVKTLPVLPSRASHVSHVVPPHPVAK